MKNDLLCIKEDVCDMAVCDGVSSCSHAVLKSAVLTQQTTNSRYELALLVYHEYEDLRILQRDGRSFERWCIDQRLHSAKAPNVS
jgi:hypothetical protein